MHVTDVEQRLASRDAVAWFHS